jgi:MOSC domain-containing protein YiiM
LRPAPDQRKIPHVCATRPEIVSVNVGSPREVQLGDRTVRTAIWKEPVDGRVPVRGVNLAGDEQADRSVHGGPDKALYAYAAEDAAWWAARTRSDFGAAPFGENLTTAGVDVSEARIGERWAVGSALLEVRQSRMPCFKLGLRMGDPRFVRAFAQADRPGAYLAIVREGDVGAGDAVEVVHRPDHDVTVRLMHRALLHDRALLTELLAAPELMPVWRQFVLDSTVSRRQRPS